MEQASCRIGDTDCRLGIPCARHSHFRSITKRTGASTDEHLLNMMREMTNGRARSQPAICPFVDGIHECIPSWLSGQQFFYAFSAPGRVRAGSPRVARNQFPINGMGTPFRNDFPLSPQRRRQHTHARSAWEPIGLPARTELTVQLAVGIGEDGPSILVHSARRPPWSSAFAGFSGLENDLIQAEETDKQQGNERNRDQKGVPA